MARKPKIFKIEPSKNGRDYSPSIGTIPELIEAYSYTLEVGASWQHEKGNKKINENPRGIKSLITNLYNAKNNAAANGYSGWDYKEGTVTVTREEADAYWAERD